MTSYKVSKTPIKNHSIIYELWDGHIIKIYRFSVPYNGGDVELFIKKNIKYMCSLTVNFASLEDWLNGE